MIQEDKFFEGADFKKQEFKALIPKYYPIKYQKYIQEETNLLKRIVKGDGRIIEAGVGIGRLIPILSPLVKEFIGIDNAKLMLKQARLVAKNFENTKIIDCNLEDLDKLYSKDYFDHSLCIWNTLGNVNKEDLVLKKLAKVTKDSIIITVYKKGTLKERENWYKTVGIKIKKIDKDHEIFYSTSGLKSKSYSKNEIKLIAAKSRLKVKQIIDLNGVMLFAELYK